jgi:hypothetical protein
LREAILAAETHKAVGDAPAGSSGANTIRFDIPGKGLHTIDLTSPLPALTGDITIDAATQPGYTNQPLIELDGQHAGYYTNGLVLNGNSNTIRGLAIDYFYGDGIVISSGYNSITGDYVGINPDGYLAAPNRKDGILITGKDNVIGGTTASARVLASGNLGAGIDLSGASATGNDIKGDYIGTDYLGFAAIANDYGIIIQGGANHNQIGGTSRVYRNIISGNTLDGIVLTGDHTSSNVIDGNYVGPDASGDAAALGGRDGILLENGASSNQIGGRTSGAGNLIGGAGHLDYYSGLIYGDGIEIIGSATAGNVIQGNWIGLNAAGLAPLDNLGGGIILDGAGKNTIGGSTKAEQNMIADQKNSSGLAATNQILAADWLVDSIEFLYDPGLRHGTFVE